MHEQIAGTAGFNHVSWQEGTRRVRREKGVTQGECNECEERETEIIVEITYELRAEETRGNKIERRRRVRKS